ncbi:hypothetical protein FOA52_010291 [Chlamydomonas sp. UWO 241]|nr:hypothetical protein FOA52_010291 [Chlamydomonas sp. UWO 241]
MGLDPLFLPGLTKSGIHNASGIQAAAIPQILGGFNVAMQSYTGSGKTLAFLLPAMTLMIRRAEALYKGKHAEVPLQLLVVAPSQELAMQIVRVAQSLLPDQHRRLVQQIIGGANPKYQEEALLMNKPLMVVGTPGRVAEFVRAGVLRLHTCPLMVLDEADQLLAPNFAEDMTHINQHCGRRAEAPRQTVLVSATLSESVLTRTAKWCPDPRYVTPAAARAPTVSPEVAAKIATVNAAEAASAAEPSWGWGAKGWDGPANEQGPRTTGAAGGVEDGLIPTMPPHLKHYFVVEEARHKADCLRRAIHALNLQRVLVFMNYQDRLKDVMFKLQARNMKSACLHGEMSKLARANVLNDFRRGRSRALVVSDVVSRGLDVSAIDAVFNAELPSSASHYAHRAGRTGRMDAPGTVISIVTRAEMFVVEKLSKRLGVPIIEAHISHGEMVLGPAPETLRYDDDDKEDGRRGRSSGSKVEAGSDDASSSSSSSSSKAGEAESGRKDAAVRGADAVASSSKAEAAPAKPRRERKPKAEPDSDDEDSDDDEDDAALDIGALERRLAADKAAAGARSPAARGGAGGSSGAGRGGGSDASGFKTELQRELEELRVERRARKVARRTGGGGGDGAGGTQHAVATRVEGDAARPLDAHDAQRFEIVVIALLLLLLLAP